MDEQGLKDWPGWSSFGYKFAKNLRELRELRGLSQQDLGERARLSRNQVSNLERNEGTKKLPNDPMMSTVYRLARALDVPPAVLLPESTRLVDLTCPSNTPLEIHFDWTPPRPRPQEVWVSE